MADRDPCTPRAPVARRAGRPLGIGFPLIRQAPSELYEVPGLVQFVELAPETVCREVRAGNGFALEIDPAALGEARRRAGGRPMVVHGVELSLGSAHGWNAAYLGALEALAGAWPFEWHSEHLSFQTFVDAGGTECDVGIPLPLPPTAEAACLVAERARLLGRRFDRPFLVENAAHYLPGLYPAAATEGEFLTAICEGGGCGLLLDLHNAYCNARNFDFDPRNLVDAMPLERVVEVHVAGGRAAEGFWTDAHDGPVPEAVWELIDHCAPRLTGWRALVFEVLDVVAGTLPLSLLREELARAHDVWNRWRPAPADPAATGQ